MLKKSVFVFIGGWVLWFWMDKGSQAFRMNHQRANEDMLANFQVAFDMLKAGFPGPAYAYIWQSHYLVLSLLGGLLLTIAFDTIGGFFNRRKMRKRFMDSITKKPEEPDRDA